jgi:hypothetical protein
MSQDQTILDPLPESSRAGISLSGILIGLIVGIMVGLFYAWQIDPLVVRNVTPADLRPEDKQAYVISAAQEYAASQDLERVVTRLLAVEPEQNPFQVAADTACELIRTGQVTDLSHIEAIRSLRTIYEPQGYQATCDVTAFNTPVPVTVVVPTPTATFTPSITPAPSKTPTKQLAPLPANSPIPNSTTIAQDNATFREAFVEQYCDPNSSGIIEVYVRDTTSLGMPGMPIEVLDQERNRAVFYTGLKPERGDDYADFEMELGETYRVGIAGLGQPSRELEAVPCDESGTIISYRVVIQRFFDQ